MLVAYTVFWVYPRRDELEIFIKQRINLLAPCTYPITYSVGGFDEKFQIKKEEFVAHIHSAEKAWEDQAKKELFQYVESGGTLQMNLFYDNRQETTNKLGEIGDVIKDQKGSYEALKVEYADLSKEYTRERAAFEKDTQTLINMRNQYESDVQYWRDHGGAPEDEYRDLEETRATINRLVTQVNQAQSQLNKKAKDLNTLAININELIDILNLSVAKYNTTSRTNGEEFEEGEYIRDAEWARINVYEFSSEGKLTRLLTHELGHALGIGHVEDPEAIMYRLNQDTNKELAQTDIAELISVCRLK